MLLTPLSFSKNIIDFDLETLKTINGPKVGESSVEVSTCDDFISLLVKYDLDTPNPKKIICKYAKLIYKTTVLKIDGREIRLNSKNFYWN